jgi:hypothetical protein
MDVTKQILSDYHQFPGLRLTKRQAARVWNLVPAHCEIVLNALVRDGQLYVDDRGQYALRRSAPFGHPSTQ